MFLGPKAEMERLELEFVAGRWTPPFPELLDMPSKCNSESEPPAKKQRQHKTCNAQGKGKENKRKTKAGKENQKEPKSGKRNQSKQPGKLIVSTVACCPIFLKYVLISIVLFSQPVIRESWCSSSGKPVPSALQDSCISAPLPPGYLRDSCI